MKSIKTPATTRNVRLLARWSTLQPAGISQRTSTYKSRLGDIFWNYHQLVTKCVTCIVDYCFSSLVSGGVWRLLGWRQEH